MDCPKCDGEMRQERIGSLIVEACSKCAGLWLRYGQLSPLLNAWEQGLDFQRASHNELPKTNKPYNLNWDQMIGPCPMCPARTLMLPSFRNIGTRVRVDYCQRGHGIWLDASEIRNIQSRVRHNAQSHETILKGLLHSEEVHSDEAA